MPFLTFLLGNWRMLVFGVLMLVLGIQTWRLDSCKKGRLEDKVGYEAKIVSLQGSLRAQNEAIAKLGKESQERKAKAEKGLLEASRNAQAARSEAQRLRDLASRKEPPSGSQACPAGEAVKEVRQGLRQ